MNLLNFERYIEVTTLVLLAAMVLVRVLPVPDAKVRLRFLYLTLIVCLIAPLCFMRQDRVGAPLSAFYTPVSGLPVLEMNGAPVSLAESLWIRIGTIPLVVSGIGLLRILWLCAGLVRLSLYRMRAQPILPLPDHLRALRDQRRVDASLFVSNEVSGPVTFGFLSPAVLLPAGFSQLDEARQSAIVCHELVHVRRNDAVKVFGEEVLRSLLWFHPCVWWLLDRIHLYREQVVDAEAIAMTEDRETYLETLLEFAKRPSMPDLAPATPFLKKHHLLERVKAIAREVTMSTFMKRVNTFALFTALPCLLALAIWRLPLQAMPQVVPDSPGVTVSTPYDLQHRGPVELPFDVLAKGVGGEVIVTVTLNASGEVAEARVVSGPAELTAAVLRSVKGWHFSSPASTPREFNVIVAFDPASAARPTVVSEPGTTATVSLAGWDRPLTIRKIDLSALPEDLQKEVLARLRVKEGSVVNAKSPSELASLMSARDSRVSLRIKNIDGVVDVTYLMPGGGSPPMPPPEVFEVSRIDASELDDATRQGVMQTLGVTEGTVITFEDFGRRSQAVQKATGTTIVLVGQSNKPGSNLPQILLRITNRPPQVAVEAAFQGKLTRIDASGLPEPLRRQVVDQLGFHLGDTVSAQEIMQKMPAIQAIDKHVNVSLFSANETGSKIEIRFYLNSDPAPVSGVSGGVPWGVRGGMVGGISGGILGGVPAGTGEKLQPIYSVVPEYPPLARQARVQGTVRFVAIVNPDGSIKNLQLLSGHPLLVPAAVEAAKQWRFPRIPPPEAKTTIDVSFTLQ